MPVVAVLGALGAAAIAAVDVAATVGGIAAITAATAFEVVAAVGATVGAVGAVTKDKTLSMVGLGLGAVGGIGALASSAGVFGAASAPLFGAAPAAATGESAVGAAEAAGGFAEGLTPATAGTVGGAIESGAWDAAAGLDAIDSIASGSLGAATAPTGLGEAPTSDLMTFASTAENAAPPADPSALMDMPNTGAPEASAVDPLTGQPLGQVGPEPYPLDANGISTAPPGRVETAGMEKFLHPGTQTPGVNDAAGTSTVSDDGIFSSILDFARKNTAVTLGALQAGGSFLSGATSSVTPAQVAYYNANAANNQAQANLLTQQQRNLAMPKAVASTSPVTGTAQPIIPPRPPVVASVPAGLMNRPQLAPVTGAVA